jgi:hypothetical protein
VVSVVSRVVFGVRIVVRGLFAGTAGRKAGGGTATGGETPAERDGIHGGGH